MLRTVFLGGIAAALVGICGVAIYAGNAIADFTEDTNQAQQAMLDKWADQL